MTTAGTFCWADIATSDPDAAKAFYGGLFGWTWEDRDMGPHGVYTVLRSDDADVAGLLALGVDRLQEGTPPHWSSYVAVPDCDAVTDRANALGAAVLAEPFDIAGAGRMAVLRDPQGAVISLWQSETTGDEQPACEGPGTVCWNELATTDRTAAISFYGELFGWRAESQPVPGEQPYIVFMMGDRPAAGALEMDERWGGVPPHWLVYFAVEDCDSTAARATELAGAVVTGPMDIENVGRLAVLRDPQGAAFAVIRFVDAMQP